MTLPNHWQFLVIGLSHQNTPIELLEKAVVHESKLELALRDLHSRDGVVAGVMLSTCNRIEVYVLGDQVELFESCRSYFENWCQIEAAKLQQHVYHLQDEAAITHLFSVAASIDSLVPGETQILGQVKQAYERHRQLRPAHPLFDRLMRKCFSVAKRVRSDTAIASHAVSIAYAAIQLAGKIFKNLKQSKVLLIGAGEMGELAAKHLLQRGIAELIVCNRSYDKAVELAQQLNATVIPIKQLHEYLIHSDIVIVATGAEDFLIQKDEIDAAMGKRHNRQLFIIDIALPRNVDPAVNAIDNVYLYNIDDLKNLVVDNLEQRKREITKARTIIQEETALFIDELHRHRHHDIIGGIEQMLRQIVLQEVDKSLPKLLTQPSQTHAELIERLVVSITAKFMQQPARYLRQHADQATAEIVKDLFLAAKPENTDEKNNSNR